MDRGAYVILRASEWERSRRAVIDATIHDARADATFGHKLAALADAEEKLQAAVKAIRVDEGLEDA